MALSSGPSNHLLSRKQDGETKEAKVAYQGTYLEAATYASAYI